MSEAELVGRAQLSNQAAWEALMHEHQQPLFRLAYLLLGDADEAEDVAQEALIRAFYALGQFDGERALRPWLCTIVMNQARNRRRSLGRYIGALKRLAGLAPTPTPSSSAQTEQTWEAQQLWEAIKRLRQQDQEVLYLRYFLELSEAEMAGALGVAAGTVKSRLHRALGRLRETVNQEFPALREARLL